MLKRLGQPGIQTCLIPERVGGKPVCCQLKQWLPEMGSVSEWINPYTESLEGGLQVPLMLKTQSDHYH